LIPSKIAAALPLLLKAINFASDGAPMARSSDPEMELFPTPQNLYLSAVNKCWLGFNHQSHPERS
jgi:hypothetical protein